VKHSVPSSFYQDVFLRKFLPPERIKEQCLQVKQAGQRLVSLNGSFDLLHAGHLEMIYQASLQGDILLVALNTDRSIQEYKSPYRPIIPLEYRMQMVAALEMVDYVTCFEETDPRCLLQEIAPHVHVNGAEYGKNCIEADVVRSLGGEIHIVSLVPGLSTSKIIQKIMSLPSA